MARPLMTGPRVTAALPVIAVTAVAVAVTAAVEATVVTLLFVRPALGIGLALLMHIPLTIIFAPAFAFAMVSGYPMFLGEQDLLHLINIVVAALLIEFAGPQDGRLEGLLTNMKASLRGNIFGIQAFVEFGYAGQ